MREVGTHTTTVQNCILILSHLLQVQDRGVDLLHGDGPLPRLGHPLHGEPLNQWVWSIGSTGPVNGINGRGDVISWFVEFNQRVWPLESNGRG